MKPTAIISIGIAFLLVVLMSASLFTVNEGQEALVLKLGKLQQNFKTHEINVFDPGLHMKTPFVTTARKFDVRLQTLDVESSRILTAEQKYVLVDYYAKWKIADLPLYYQRTGGQPSQAEMLLSQKINDALRANFGKHNISEVIAGERMNIMSLLKSEANASAKTLGIHVTDVRIKRIDLPEQVSQSVFQRMSTEREQVATKHRSQGKAQAEVIKAGADAHVAVSVATAKAQASEIRAGGDKSAATIYSKAYNQDPSFYALYKSLEAYQTVFNKHHDVMVLQPKGQFFKYFNPTAKNVASAR